MGSKISSEQTNSAHLSDRTIAMLTEHVQCTPTEVQNWHSRFLSLAPEGRLKRRDFERLYSQAYPGFDTKGLAHLIYRYFDSDHSGYQRARAIFHIIDSSDDNEINIKELRKALEALYHFRGLVAELPGMDTKTKANQIMAMMDYDGDRMISEQEFIYALTKDPDLRGILDFDYSTPLKRN